jgi:hypothetical protein
VVRTPVRGQQPNHVRALAAQLFVQCFPMLLADSIRRAHPLASAQFYLLGGNAAALAPGLVGDDARAVIASAWVDLAEEPIVLRLPATHGRHLTVTLFGSTGEPFASVGSRSGHDGGADIAVVGPHWRGELPSGLSARRAPGDSAWVVSRLYAHSGIDHTAALGIAKRQCVALLRPNAPPPSATLPFLAPPSPPTVRQVASLSPELLLRRVHAMIERAPGASNSAAARMAADLLAEVDDDDAQPWPEEFAATVAKGLADGLEAVRAAAVLPTHDGLGEWRGAASNEAGWPSPALESAARAYSAMGSPEREDLLSFTCHHDSRGQPLSGACSYEIHFPRNGLPPAEAFWWLSALPATAATGRHGVGDRNDLVLNRDGSLDILIQSAPPEPNLIPNWLPAPEGQFSLCIRLHWPRTPALTGSWRMPPVERTDSGVAASGPGGRGARPPDPPWNDPTHQHREMSLLWRGL